MKGRTRGSADAAAGPGARRTRLSRIAAWALTVALLTPKAAAGQWPVLTEASNASSQPSVPEPYPSLDMRRELRLLVLGAGFLGASHLVPEPTRPLPTAGLDPTRIQWSFDRSTVGPTDDSAERASDWTRDGALALPLVLSWLMPPDGDQSSASARTGVVFAETLLLTGGLTRLGKTVFGRARPFAYLPENQRPPEASTPVPSTETFYSFPSGHSAMAWASASLAVTEHLLRRPSAHWTENLGVGFVGGALAGATSALRVEAGVHFPSDVVAGAGLGILTGVAVPLAHRGGATLPTSRAWLEVAGGALAGTLFGLVLAGAY